MKFGIYFFLGIVTVLSVASCQTITEPYPKSFTPISIEKIDLSEVVLQAEMTYFNPNPIGGRLKEVYLNVYANEVYVSDVTQDLDTEIKPNAEFIIPIEITVPVKSLLSKDSGLIGGLVNALTSRKVKVKYSGTATINFAKVDIDVVISKEDELDIKL